MLTHPNVDTATTRHRSSVHAGACGVPHRRGRALPHVWLFVALTFAVLTTANAQGSDTSRSDPFHDRWLRSLMLPGVDEIPHFAGPVAEVTRSSASGGRVTEARVWRLDERGWPTDTELTLFANNAEYTYTSSWTYGSDGLPTTIEIGGGTHDVVFLSWGASSVDVASSTSEMRFTYDTARDVLEVNQTVPNEVRRVFTFQPDGSYSYEFFSNDENGTMQLAATGTVDSSNLRTGSASSTFATSVSVSERDERGNPVAATMARSGAVTGAVDLTWDITYR